MLTPCNDEDPAAAVATAPLKGEDNNSMMRLTLLKNDSTAVSRMMTVILNNLLYFIIIYSLRLPHHGTCLFIIILA